MGIYAARTVLPPVFEKSHEKGSLRYEMTLCVEPSRLSSSPSRSAAPEIDFLLFRKEKDNCLDDDGNVEFEPSLLLSTPYLTQVLAVSCTSLFSAQMIAASFADFSLSELMRLLCFESERHAVNFLRAYSLKVSDTGHVSTTLLFCFS